MLIVELLVLCFLLCIMAFFVMVETSFWQTKFVRIEQYVSEGKKGSQFVKTVFTSSEYWILAQVGIIIFSILAAIISNNFFKKVFPSWTYIFTNNDTTTYFLSNLLSISVSLLLVVVLGKLIPHYIMEKKSEKILFRIAKFMILFRILFLPFIWLTYGLALLLTKNKINIKNFGYSEVHSENELRIMVNESYKNGVINVSEYNYVNNIFEFNDRVAKEIMIPRTEIVTLEYSNTVRECLAIFSEENFTRYIVIDQDKDRVLGMINVKEILTNWVVSGEKKSLSYFIRPVIRVLDSIPIHELLIRMQRERIHIAVLMDEYGGTSGMVTVEDIIEEIVGEIRDEFDSDEINEIQKVDENKYIVAAKVLIEDINSLFDLNIDDEDVDTIGGWILMENYEVTAGDIIEYSGLQFKVLEIDDRQIRFIEIFRQNDS